MGLSWLHPADTIQSHSLPRKYVEHKQFFLKPSGKFFNDSTIDGKMTVSITSVQVTVTTAAHDELSNIELGTTDPSDQKPYLSEEAMAHSRWSRLKHCFKLVEGTMARFWPRIENVWRAMRDSLSLPGWLGVTATLATGILALRYAYQSQVLAYRSMKLAEWTAKKDFLEMCQLANVCFTLLVCFTISCFVR